MTDRIRLATAGTGYVSRYHYDAWQRIDGVELAGVFNRNAESARQAAARFGGRAYRDLETMIADERPELLDIITPSPGKTPVLSSSTSTAVPPASLTATAWWTIRPKTNV
jgi:predicted dehydrogenase